MTVFLLKICFVLASSHTLLHEKRLNYPGRTVVVAKRPSASWRHRHRRQHQHQHAPSSPYRRRRRAPALLTRSPDFLRRVSHSFAWTEAASRDAPLPNSIDRVVVERLFEMDALATEEDLPKPAPLPRPRVGHNGQAGSIDRVLSSEAMPPPPPPASATPATTGPDDLLETRSTRSASSASRTTNRLSLTLPIAPPSAYPSRPTPSSSTAASFPPTPIDTPGVTSPTDPTDFITAIAAQERRVLELREELGQAEHELSRLKKQWAHQESHKKRAEIRRTEPMRPLAPQTDSPVNHDDVAAVRRSVELDRRKALLLGQQSAQSTPTQSRRRVFTGSHARTLSLLSPTKAPDAFSVHEDQSDDVTSPSKEPDSQSHQNFSRYSPMTPAQLSKRASWAPRSVHQVSGLKQVADDFKAGLWTFVEDLRQATVGDEPITGSGAPMRGIDGNSRRSSHGPLGEDQETIRAPGSTARPHVARAFEGTPTPPSRFADPRAAETTGSSGGRQNRKSSGTESKAKRFSWTPLAVDSYDDNDWSNWDSPTPKSPRWSGTTVNGDGIPAIPEKGAENGTPLKTEQSAERSSTPPMSPTKLDELIWPTALNRLTPGNIKKTATDFMKDWEKSLSPPPAGTASAGGAPTDSPMGM